MTPGVPTTKAEPLSRRLGPQAASRVEGALRARSGALKRRSRSVGRCPGCGQAVSPEDDWMRVGGLIVHPACLFVCRGDPPAAA